MRMTKSFIYTTKEIPKDAELKSHQLLLRAGYIQQVGAGIYNLLPLGHLVLQNIESIIRKHLNQSGCVELTLGFVTPASFWQKSGRYEQYGKELLRFQDRKNQDFVLGPTYEEGIVECVRGNIKSYKQLPINLYQIHLKFRDEVRPRFGLIRGREFVMKDGYSFHSSYEDLDREFELMEHAYRKIFDELGVDYAVVDADSGAIGGSGSKEFMLLADCGEDTLIICPSCSYASNIEAAKRQKTPYTPLDKEVGLISTPNLKTIAELSSSLDILPSCMIKCVAKGVRVEGEEKILSALFFVLGSDELEETKALNAVKIQNPKALELVELNEEELRSFGFEVGFIGIGAKADFVIYDEELREGEKYLSGANQKDMHQVLVLKPEEQRDIIKVRAKDRCVCCGEQLQEKKGIEIGHIFKLGEKYSKPMGATFLDCNGKAQNFIMGCYGIGVSRLISAIVEQRADERGMVWSEGIAPYDVVVIVSNIKNEEQKAMGERIYEYLLSQGKKVLLDDRDERFGAKMTDFELLGIPYAYLVGKELENGNVERINRLDLQKKVLKIDEVLRGE